VCLKCRSDFVSCLQRLVDGPVPCGVVNHAASITITRSPLRDAAPCRLTPGHALCEIPAGHDRHPAATCLPDRTRVHPASASSRGSGVLILESR
jgi:hypothetical protein